jgi:ribosomal protein S18 acetylase RimI-like enzyme
MALPDPLRAFWYTLESLNPRCVRTDWGVVMSDPRYPHVYEENKACILEPAPNLTLADLRRDLSPLLDGNGVGYEHIETMDLDDPCPAVGELSRIAGRVHADVVMVHVASEAEAGPPGELDAGEIVEPDDAFWAVYRESRNEFGETMAEDVVDELVRRDREVLVPAGLRLFGGFVDGRLAGFTSLLSMRGVSYVDNVVTLQPFRRRGVASATVTLAVEAARAGGDGEVFLMADEGGDPQRLYERLGFRVAGRAGGFTNPREPVGPTT